MSGRKMNARIPVTPEVQRTLRAFANAAGVTYDDLLRWFLASVDVDVSDAKTAAMEGAKRHGDIPVYQDEPEAES